MAAFEVIALDTATPQLRAPGVSDTYTFPRAVEMPLGTANGVLYLNGSKVVTSGSALTFDGNNLGIGATPLFKLDVQGASGLAFRLMETSTGNNNRILISQSGTETIYNATYSTGSASQVWQLGTAEQMRLTNTGLGIGTSSPAYKLDVRGVIAGGNGTIVGGISFSSRAEIGAISNHNLGLITNNVTHAILDTSGNLGLGVAPSASNLPTIESQYGLFVGQGQTNIVANAYYSSGYLYKSTAAASRYQQITGQHIWYTAPSGTAGNAISFTQALTLDASGNLGVGVTSISGFRVDILSTSTDAAVRARSSNSNEVLRVESAGTSLAAIRFINTSVNNTYISADGTALTFTTNAQERARIPAAGGMVVGTAALATTATDGFLYVPTCAGTPTGTPTTQTGTAPIVVDTTNNKLYFYSGGQWRDAGP